MRAECWGLVVLGVPLAPRSLATSGIVRKTAWVAILYIIYHSERFAGENIFAENVPIFRKNYNNTSGCESAGNQFFIFGYCGPLLNDSQNAAQNGLKLRVLSKEVHYTVHAIHMTKLFYEAMSHEKGSVIKDNLLNEGPLYYTFDLVWPK